MCLTGISAQMNFGSRSKHCLPAFIVHPTLLRQWLTQMYPACTHDIYARSGYETLCLRLELRLKKQDNLCSVCPGVRLTSCCPPLIDRGRKYSNPEMNETVTYGETIEDP